jgi:NADPH:quinone reductase-like Zn-dependent oxidoreductase
MLMRANVQSDDTVLVTGASGGVGSAAVQLAKAYGARTIAVTGAAKRERLVELGADATVDRSANIVRELGANSVDVIVDAVAGPTLPSLFELLRPGGRYAVSGAIAGPMIELDVRTLYLKDLSFFGCTVLDIGTFDRLIERIESGQIRPIIAATYPLREIGEAQIEFQAKTHVGKIVLDVAEGRP